MLLTINPFLKDKASKDEIKATNRMFMTMDIPMDELAALIGEGAAFSAQFNREGRSKAANFKAAGFLAVDVDRGLTIEDARKVPLYQHHCALLYTTASHTEENHRFRLVFELETPITTREHMEAAYSGLIATFGGDKACRDASRLFFGYSKGTQIHQPGLMLPTSVVDELVVLGKDFMEREAAEDKVKTEGFSGASYKSNVWIPKDKKIRTAEGKLECLEDIPLKTRVYCPIHIDAKPSAFVLESRKKVKGIHCASHCKATFFLDNGYSRAAMSQPYDFDYDWENSINTNSVVINAHLEALEEYFGDNDARIFTNKVNGQYLPESVSPTTWDSPEHARVLPSIIGVHTPFIGAKDVACHYPKFTNDYFVGKGNAFEKAKEFRDKTILTGEAKTLFEEKAVHNWLMNEGMTFIKSPKGSGKTQMLEDMVKTYKAHNKNVRILLIGHRRSLINATAKRLDLTSYLNTDETSSREFNSPTQHYAISLDSLGKLLVNTKAYDVVIIDEVEQVFAHLLSDTLRKDRMKAILYLQHFVTLAKYVYLLDADMTPLSVEIMSALNKASSNKDAFAVINTYKAGGRELNLYNHKDAKNIVADLMAALKGGKRCFLCSNSKDRIEGLAKQLRKMMPDKKVITITSKNSQKPEVQDFILNIKDEALKYDLIAVSPSMSTGVDITFPDDAELIDCVFGIFHTGINTHFDIDQQLCRVRHPGQVNVWVDDTTYNFETDSNVIRQEMSQMHDMFEAIEEIDASGSPVYFQKSAADHLHEAIYGAVTEMKRASMNNLRANFVGLREHNGWKCAPVERDDNKTALGGFIISEGEKEQQMQKAVMILNAPQVNVMELYELKGKNSLSEQEQAVVDRYYLEKFFHTDVTKEMLGTDKGESLKEAVKLYDIFQMSANEREAADVTGKGQFQSDAEEVRLKYYILHPILMASGLFDGTRFIRDKKVYKGDLRDFVKLCKEQKVRLETFCNIEVSKRIDFDPITQLKNILSPFGVTTKPDEKPKSYSDGSKKYYHSLDTKTVDFLEKWHAQYRNEEAEALWTKARGFDELINESADKKKAKAKKAIQKLRAKAGLGDDDVELS